MFVGTCVAEPVVETPLLSDPVLSLAFTSYDDDHSRLARAVDLFNRTRIATFTTGLNRIPCYVPGCDQHFDTRENVSEYSRFICKNHPRTVQVHAANRNYDPKFDHLDEDAAFQQGAFERGFAATTWRPHSNRIGGRQVKIKQASICADKIWTEQRHIDYRDYFRRLAAEEDERLFSILKKYVEAYSRGARPPGLSFYDLCEELFGRPFGPFKPDPFAGHSIIVRFGEERSLASADFLAEAHERAAANRSKVPAIPAVKSRKKEKKDKKVTPEWALTGMDGSFSRSTETTVERRISFEILDRHMRMRLIRGEYFAPSDPPEHRRTLLIDGVKFAFNRANKEFLKDDGLYNILFGWSVSEAAVENDLTEDQMDKHQRKTQDRLEKLESLKKLGFEDPFMVDRLVRLSLGQLAGIVENPENYTHALIERNNKVVVCSIAGELTEAKLDTLYHQLVEPAVKKVVNRADDLTAMIRDAMAERSQNLRMVGEAQFVSHHAAVLELYRRRQAGEIDEQ